MTPYDRAWEMGSYTEYMWSYDGICQVVRIPDAGSGESESHSVTGSGTVSVAQFNLNLAKWPRVP